MTSGEALSVLVDSGGKYGQAAKGSNTYRQWRAVLGIAEGESFGSIMSDIAGPIFGGLFGGGDNPNKGSKNLVDAIDNYEKISTRKAKNMRDGVVQMIASGASYNKIAEFINEKAGNPYSVNDIMNSYKWDIIKPMIDAIRKEAAKAIKEQKKNKTPAPNTANKTKAGGGNITIFLVAAAILGIIFYK